MRLLLLPFLMLCLTACTVNLLDDITGSRKPLRESVLLDGSRDKIVLLNINGEISDESYAAMLSNSASMIESAASQLDMAANDPKVKALVIKINSPGGGVTASENLYKLIADYKQSTGNPVVVSMQDLAASGGYYISLAADSIFAMNSTITGSVGVILAYPNFAGLMDRFGVRMEVYKSGENKDLISMFRNPTSSDKEVLQGIVNENATAFWNLVQTRRRLSDDTMTLVKTARIFSGTQALKLGLVDKIGFLDDAILEAGKMASVKGIPTVVTYRQNDFPDDNIYNTRMSSEPKAKALLDLGAIQSQLSLKPGIHYRWIAE